METGVRGISLEGQLPCSFMKVVDLVSISLSDSSHPVYVAALSESFGSNFEFN